MTLNFYAQLITGSLITNLEIRNLDTNLGTLLIVVVACFKIILKNKELINIFRINSHIEIQKKNKQTNKQKMDYKNLNTG